MKNIKLLMMGLVASAMFTSCVDDEAYVDQFKTGTNVIAFNNRTEALTAVADGNEYSFDIQMLTKGPRLSDATGDVTVTVSVDPSSTAVEGTHFRLDQTSVTISKSDNYLGELPVTVLTDGIAPPLAETPVLVLNLSNASGDASVVASSAQVTIDLLYLCFSNLAGVYDLVTERDNGPDAIFPGEVITQQSDGVYKTTTTYRWAPGTIAPDQGLTFIDVCDVLTVPSQGLAQGFYSNEVVGTEPGEVLPNGDLVLHYSVDFSSGAVVNKGNFTKL